MLQKRKIVVKRQRRRNLITTWQLMRADTTHKKLRISLSSLCKSSIFHLRRMEARRVESKLLIAVYHLSAIDGLQLGWRIDACDRSYQELGLMPRRTSATHTKYKKKPILQLFVRCQSARLCFPVHFSSTLSFIRGVSNHVDGEMSRWCMERKNKTFCVLLHFTAAAFWCCM